MTGQRAKVLSHLKNKGGLTSMEAFTLYGITRLAAVVHKLRDDYDIESHYEYGINRYGDECRFVRYYYLRDLRKTQEV